MILVLLRVNDRDLALPERAVERAVHGLRLNSKTRGRVAITTTVVCSPRNCWSVVTSLQLRILLEFLHQISATMNSIRRRSVRSAHIDKALSTFDRRRECPGLA